MLKKLPIAVTRYRYQASSVKSLRLLVLIFFLLLVTCCLSLAASSVLATETSSFIIVKDLQIGDTVFVKDGDKLKPEKIVEKKWVEETVDVYNFKIAGAKSYFTKTYFANDFAVHNQKRTSHRAYFFLDNLTGGSPGYHDAGERTLVWPAEPAFASLLGDDDYLVLPNNNTSEGTVVSDDDFTWVSEHSMTRGDDFHAVPQTMRTGPYTSPYYVGGVKFKDYDGSPRPAYHYFMNCWWDDGRDHFVCSEDYLRFRETYMNDFKPEKDYTGNPRGMYVEDCEDWKLQLAEFNVDYTGRYKFHTLGGEARYAGTTATIYPKLRDVNMPVLDIYRVKHGWSPLAPDDSYGSYTASNIRDISAMCACRGDNGRGDCLEYTTFNDNSVRWRGKWLDDCSGNPAWSSFWADVAPYTQGFAAIGGLSNVRVMTMWSHPDEMQGAWPADSIYQWVITRDTPPRAYSRYIPRQYRGNSGPFSPWQPFTEDAGANGYFAFLGGLANIKSRDLWCSLWNCEDRVFTENNQVWQRSATLTVNQTTFRFNYNWGNWSPVTATYETLLASVGARLQDVKETEVFCTDVSGYEVGLEFHYCKDIIMTADQIYSRVYQQLPEWTDLGLGDNAVCGATAGSSGPANCWLDKNQTYMMLTYIQGSDIEGWQDGYSGFPILFWAGGQEDNGGWYADHDTSAIPVAPMVNVGGITGKVFADVGLNCADPATDPAVEGATVYLDSPTMPTQQFPVLANGLYTFSGVTAGSHNIYISPPAAYKIDPTRCTNFTQFGTYYYQTITVVGGSTVTANFPLLHTGTITGYVYKNMTLSPACDQLDPPDSEAVQGVRPYSNQGLNPPAEDRDGSDSSGYFVLEDSTGSNQLIAGTYFLNVSDVGLPSGYDTTDAHYYLYRSASDCFPNRLVYIDPVNGSLRNPNNPSQVITEIKIALLANPAWWQTTGGDIHADGGGISSIIADPIVCLSPACKPYLMLDDSISGHPGIPTWSTGSSLSLGPNVDDPDNISETSEDWHAMAGGYGGTEYNYDYWSNHLADESKLTLGGSTLVPNPTAIYEFNTGPLELTGGNLSSSNKVIILHTGGDLNITGNISVAPGSFLMVVTSGNINIASSVASLQGIFIADDSIGFGSGDIPLDFQGSLVSWDTATGINLSGRDFGDARNNTEPILDFKFRPDFLITAPAIVKRPSHSWREIPG